MILKKILPALSMISALSFESESFVIFSSLLNLSKLFKHLSKSMSDISCPLSLVIIETSDLIFPPTPTIFLIEDLSKELR